MPIKERDIVLQGRDGGEDTIDLPITRLGNVESGAEVKAEPAQGDYIPLIDSADNEQMKKFPAKVLTDAAETAERALKAVQRVAYVIDTLPYQTGTLTFTGEEQSPAWGAFDPEKLEISGVTSAVNAGEYEAVFTPKGDYVWTDESVEPRTVKWSIGRAAVAAAPSVAGSLTYTGAEQSPAWTGYDPEKLELGGDISGVNAGSYTASFTPTANYQWVDGTVGAKTVGWTIAKAAVAVPSQSGSRTYNGKAQSPAWSNYDAAKLTIGGTTSGTNAGSYNAVFTPKANYCWSDGTAGEKTVSWTIGKAAGSVTLNKSSLALSFAAKTGTITVTRAGTGAITAASSNTNIATVSVSGNTVTVTAKAGGSVTVTVSVGADGNYNAVSKTCAVSSAWPVTTLNSNSWAVIRAVSDAGQGANWWKVGDTKSITINGKVGNTTFSNLAIDVFILGFNHNSSREGSNRIHFEIGKIGGKLVGLIDAGYVTNTSSTTAFNMNASLNNSGGWNNSLMRKTILGNSKTPTSPLANSFMAALPADLRAVMKSVIKYSDNTGGGADIASNVTATTDYLFLLSPNEYTNFGGYANNTEKNFQAQYDYYKAGNSAVHYTYSNVDNAAQIWCRSASCCDNGYFCVLNSLGKTNDRVGAQLSLAIAPGFCV